MEEQCKPADKSKSSKMSRRTWLSGAVAATMLYVQSSFGKTIEVASPLLLPGPNDPTKKLEPGPSKLVKRSLFETPVRKPSDISSRKPLQNLYSTITPADLHFERHHGGVPVIDPEKNELLIHGMVNKPMKFTLRDLKRFPSVTRTCFIECAGNFRTGKENMTVQEVCGLTSQSEWTGVMLST